MCIRDRFYIIQVDESQFWGVMDTREKWLDAVRVILLYEPTVDARDLMGDTWDLSLIHIFPKKIVLKDLLKGN